VRAEEVRERERVMRNAKGMTEQEEGAKVQGWEMGRPW
jgi:hypothetical protein